MSETVQSLIRGLAVLEALNLRNGSSINQIAKSTGLSRATAYRMMETLRRQGYLRRNPEDGRYWLEQRCRALADGYDDDAWVGAVAMPRMGALSRRILWPLSLTTPSGTEMLLRATTDTDSPLTRFHAPIGYRMPLLFSSSGWAYLAYCEPDQRRLLIDVARRAGSDRFGRAMPSDSELSAVLERTRHLGYATYESLEQVSNIAVPIFTGGRAFAALVLRYFTRSLSLAEAVSRYLDDLKATAADIGHAFDAYGERPDDDLPHRATG